MSDTALLRQILAGLRAILAEQQRQGEAIEALRSDLAGRGAAPTLRRDQVEALSKILPVLGAVFGGTRFGVWQAMDLVEQQTTEGMNIALALAGRNARQLGKLLQLALGRDFGGIRIERAGQDMHGKRWQILQ